MSQEQRFTEGCALLIGVGQYKEKELSVPITARDAVDLGELLMNPRLCGYPPDHVTMLTNEDATQEYILASLEQMRDRVARMSNATACIFFSGHGLVADDYYFLLHETQMVKRNGTRELDLKTALAHQLFLEKVRQITAQRLVIFLNTCFSGAVGTALGEIERYSPVPLGLYDELARGSGRVIIASSGPGQKSWIKGGERNSIFVKHLLSGLGGEAAKGEQDVIFIMDIFNYVNEMVEKDVQALGEIQVPELKVYSLTKNFPIALRSRSQRLSFLARNRQMTRMRYNTARVRQLLREAVSDQELSELCMDYVPVVYEQFSVGMSKAQKIQVLIEYCSRHNAFEIVFAVLEKANPEKYEEYRASLDIPS